MALGASEGSIRIEYEQNGGGPRREFYEAKIFGGALRYWTLWKPRAPLTWSNTISFPEWNSAAAVYLLMHSKKGMESGLPGRSYLFTVWLSLLHYRLAS